MTDPQTDEVQAPLSTEDRVAALESKVDALIAELHRHISLRLETPAPAAPPAADPDAG